MISAYYNEFDPKAAAWLRQLIKNGNITQGEVDERSITEVRPEDLRGFGRVHFFAGIGTWDYCLNQAGWGDRPIWTASLPCQPFSAAGKGLGKADERHLLPHYLNLVRECRPDIQIGEQVERAIAHRWLDDLQANMEAEGYAVGHCVLGAHSIGAPHIRQRLYWVAHSEMWGGYGEIFSSKRKEVPEPIRSGASHRLGFSNSTGSQPGIEAAKAARYGGAFKSTGGLERMANARYMPIDRLGSPSITTSQRHTGSFHSQKKGINRARGSDGDLCFGSSDASEIEWIYCRDNKYRPVKPGILPLVDGASERMVHSSDPNNTQAARVMRLKGYGNAIQAQTAIAFIKAYMSINK